MRATPAKEERRGEHVRARVSEQGGCIERGSYGQIRIRGRRRKYVFIRGHDERGGVAGGT